MVILAPGIYKFDFLSDETCDLILTNSLTTSTWDKAKITENIIKNNDSVIDLSFRTGHVNVQDSTSLLHAEFDKIIKGKVFPFLKENFDHILSKHSSVQLLKYSEGDFFSPHTDSSLNYTNRYYTIVCYLNDDFSGGRTYFPKIDLYVKAEKGKAIIFPSAYYHGSETITKGVKYVAVAWLIDNPPLKWI